MNVFILLALLAAPFVILGVVVFLAITTIGARTGRPRQ
jgi:hypothetical protein